MVKREGLEKMPADPTRAGIEVREREMVRRCVDGDTTSWRTLYDRHFPDVERLVGRVRTDVRVLDVLDVLDRGRGAGEHVVGVQLGFQLHGLELVVGGREHAAVLTSVDAGGVVGPRGLEGCGRLGVIIHPTGPHPLRIHSSDG